MIQSNNQLEETENLGINIITTRIRENQREIISNENPTFDDKLRYSIDSFGKQIFSYLAWALAITSFILCGLWASSNNVNDGYLGIPQWNFDYTKFNMIASHTILSVCGFFFAQVLAMTSYTIFSPLYQNESMMSFMHVFWHLVAFSTLIASLVAITNYFNETKKPNLVSTHSWLGIAAATLYFHNISLGFLFSCDDSFTSMVGFKRYHSFIGLAAFASSGLAIASGISEYNEYFDVCTYKFDTPTDANPALNYNKLPIGCKLSNGLSISILAASLCVGYAVIIHMIDSYSLFGNTGSTILSTLNSGHRTEVQFTEQQNKNQSLIPNTDLKEKNNDNISESDQSESKVKDVYDKSKPPPSIPPSSTSKRSEGEKKDLIDASILKEEYILKDSDLRMYKEFLATQPISARPKILTVNDEYVYLIKFEQYLKKKYEEEEEALGIYSLQPSMAGEKAHRKIQRYKSFLMKKESESHANSSTNTTPANVHSNNYNDFLQNRKDSESNIQNIKYYNEEEKTAYSDDELISYRQFLLRYEDFLNNEKENISYTNLLSLEVNSNFNEKKHQHLNKYKEYLNKNALQYPGLDQNTSKRNEKKYFEHLNKYQEYLNNHHYNNKTVTSLPTSGEHLKLYKDYLKSSYSNDEAEEITEKYLNNYEEFLKYEINFNV